MESTYLVPFIFPITIAIQNGYVSFLKMGQLLIYQGDGVPGDTDPAGLHFPGKKKISTAQFVPRASKEMQEHSSEYEILHDGLEPIFKWIETVVSIFLF